MWRVSSVVLLACAVGFLHHEVLFQGQVYHLEDAADGYYPSHVAARRALSEGTLPTWERGSWAGWPLANDPYYGVFYPLSVIFWGLGAVRGLGVTVALHTLAAGLGMLWLLRRRKLPVEAALLGAVSFGLSTFMVVRIRHVIFPQLMAWLPLILAGVEGFIAERRRRDLVLVAAATGMALLCGALPLAFYLVLAVGAYALPRLFRAEGRRPVLGLLALAGVVGGFIGAAQLVPTAAHIPLSPRQLGVDYTFASSYAWPDLRYLGTLIAPDLFGVEERGRWFGAFNHWEMAGYYAGAAVVLLSPLGLLRARGRAELWALMAIALVGVALAFGDGGPLHGFFFRHVPLYGTLRCPTRALILTLVAFPILAAEGATWLLERRPRIGAVAAGALLLVAGGAAWLYLRRAVTVPPPEQEARLALSYLSAVLAATGAALVALGLARGERVAHAAVAALALVTLVDLVTVGRGYVQPKPSDFPRGTERFAAVDWLLARHPEDRFAPAAYGPFRLHNLGMTYGLEGAGGYDSVTVWRYVNFLYTLNHGAPYPHDKLKDDLAAGTIQRFDSPLVDLLNVRWAIAPYPPGPRWVERFRPRPGDPPHARHEKVWDARLAVYENPQVLPRAFVVYRAQVHADDAAHAAALAKLDPRAVVLLDRAPEVTLGDVGRPPTPARIATAERHRLVIEAEPVAPGVLVVSEAHYPGWSVTVDGRPAPLLRANYALRGVALTPGKHTVEMRFTSRPTRVGLALSGAGVLGLFALAWARGRRRGSMV